MRSLAVSAPRTAMIVHPTKANPIVATEAITPPIVKALMIRKTLSLMAQEKNNWTINNGREKSVAQKIIAEFLKAESIEESKEYLLLEKMIIEFLTNNAIIKSEKNSPLMLLSASQSQAEKNSTAQEDFKLEEKSSKQKISEENEYIGLEKLKAKFHKFLYGEKNLNESTHKKNLIDRQIAFCGSLASRISAEQDWDSSPENRFISCFDPELKVRRYDKKPEDKIMFRKDPNNSKKELIGPQGKKIYPNVHTYFSKSLLDEKGRIIPVNNLFLDVFTEHFPITLANIVYKHVADTNKAVVQRGYEFDSDQEISSLDRSKMLSELDGLEKKASPLTSASLDATRPALFMAWGKPDQYIEIDPTKIRILSPSQIVNLILYVANDEHAYKEAKFGDRSKFNWKEHDKNIWDEKSLKDTEKALIDHGIDPDGDWTEREKTAYYTLIAGEWLVVGVTQEDVARIVYKSE